MIQVKLDRLGAVMAVVVGTLGVVVTAGASLASTSHSVAGRSAVEVSAADGQPVLQLAGTSSGGTGSAAKTPPRGSSAQLDGGSSADRYGGTSADRGGIAGRYDPRLGKGRARDATQEREKEEAGRRKRAAEEEARKQGISQ